MKLKTFEVIIATPADFDETVTVEQLLECVRETSEFFNCAVEVVQTGEEKEI
jgi:hypothetical protein